MENFIIVSVDDGKKIPGSCSQARRVICLSGSSTRALVLPGKISDATKSSDLKSLLARINSRVSKLRQRNKNFLCFPVRAQSVKARLTYIFIPCFLPPALRSLNDGRAVPPYPSTNPLTNIKLPHYLGVMRTDLSRGKKWEGETRSWVYC